MVITGGGGGVYIGCWSNCYDIRYMYFNVLRKHINATMFYNYMAIWIRVVTFKNYKIKIKTLTIYNPWMSTRQWPSHIILTGSIEA